MGEQNEQTQGRERTRLTPAQAFMQFLTELREGAAVVDWGEDLRELVDAVKATGNPGELNIVLKFELLDAEGFGRVSVMDKTKTKRPRRSHDATTYAITADDELAVIPPEQLNIEGMN